MGHPWRLSAISERRTLNNSRRKQRPTKTTFTGRLNRKNGKTRGSERSLGRPRKRGSFQVIRGDIVQSRWTQRRVADRRLETILRHRPGGRSRTPPNHTPRKSAKTPTPP